MRKGMRRRASAEYADIVLETLRKAQRPISAYEIISMSRADAAMAPPTAYRALERLIELGLAHKLESLNAFVACSHSAHHDDMAFAICDSCGSVAEFKMPAIAKALGSWSRSTGFKLNASMIELHGECTTCCEAAPL